jgi:hypothetical protein
MDDHKTIVDRDVLKSKKEVLFLQMAVVYLDIACLETEVEGRGEYLLKFLKYSGMSLRENGKRKEEVLKCI